ncbi:MAG: sodium:alanine symporter family protein [Oscillospiraceae bacterium]|nr:sodium:alanine symporter family protein [Oscillospiraceae bacterium]
MEKLISAISETVWGFPMLVLVLGCGIYYTFRLRFLQITRFREWTKETFGTFCGKKNAAPKEGVSPWKAVCTALASSIGTGNIAGVATAIVSGGAGAVFWMWVAAFFGMAVKYAEIFLAVKFRSSGQDGFYGGPMYYIEKGIGKSYRPLGAVFSVAGAFACIGMGAMSQANSISSVVCAQNGIPVYVVGVVIASIAAVSLAGGIKKTAQISSVLVPFMAGAYILGGVVVIVFNPARAIYAFSEILGAALTPKAVYGAAAGEMFGRAVRYGVSRGVFSNEAGLGSAPIIHAAANARSPEKQGFWGVFEVFVDTILVCSVTAVVLIMSGVDRGAADGAGLVSLAFSEFFGPFGGVFVGFATVMFAISTILGWSYYGEMCVSYLTGQRRVARKLYRIIFVLSTFVGAITCATQVWEIADMFNGIMMIPNLIALILLSGVVTKKL